ncbi:G-protein coupled receptors family 1 profile domain-containing protein [Caenorhabditis elegans]|uniref:G-protein coupled receptors family 1 profile domain-containing protein n=1 Tax=Caenorhabditis elegans TaxID=6239 RepID=G3MU49_CAEEL|nr:G-protein coupled receptors family 1 profile domain-containing protein [Caenorhabditis elegans]CCD31040.1 G-protein coupled receptors family 1 profile domain-containing protein [Caenorhabditis elegans]|eukprot:NP_001256658.1 Serpentine Receptor, class W [Caenorhabditis elegans]
MPKSTTTTTAIPDDNYLAYDYDTDYDIYKTIYNISTKTNLYLEIATIIVNFFHLIVLLQKEMRLCAVYIFMIGLCISDIILTSINFYNQAGELGWLPILFAGSDGISCLREDYIEINIGMLSMSTTSQITCRLSLWLAILMAVIRLLSVTFPMSQRVKNFTAAKGSVIILIICLMFWILYSTWQFALFRVLWLPDNASELSAIYTAESLIAVLKTFNAFSHFFVCFFLSSQYRNVAKSLIIPKKQNKPVELTRSTSTITVRSKTKPM